jgi:hypothetical protein
LSDDAFDLDLAATSMLGDNRDVRMLLKVLASQLSGPLGDRLNVERQGGLLHKSDEIKSVRATIGNEEFGAELKGGAVTCTVGHQSGGIRIRSEQLEMDQWLRRLLGGLQVEAAHSQAARLALENIVIGGQE